MLEIDIGAFTGNNWYSLVTSLLSTDNIGSGDIYTNMRIGFDKKYNLDFEFSERDLELYNSGEKYSLNVVYENGKVALSIRSVRKNDYEIENRFYVTYRRSDWASKFYNASKPNKASIDDF